MGKEEFDIFSKNMTDRYIKNTRLPDGTWRSDYERNVVVSMNDMFNSIIIFEYEDFERCENIKRTPAMCYDILLSDDMIHIPRLYGVFENQSERDMFEKHRSKAIENSKKYWKLILSTNCNPMYVRYISDLIFNIYDDTKINFDVKLQIICEFLILNYTSVLSFIRIAKQKHDELFKMVLTCLDSHIIGGNKKNKLLCIMYTYYLDNIPNELNKYNLENALIKNINEKDVKYLLMHLCVMNKSKYYSDEELVKLYLELLYKNHKNVSTMKSSNKKDNEPIIFDDVHSKYNCILNIFDYMCPKYDCMHDFLLLHAQSRAKYYTDQECSEIISLDEERFVGIGELMYLNKKWQSPQKMTLANNSNDCVVNYVVRNQIYELQPHERIILRNFRENGIIRVPLRASIVYPIRKTLFDVEHIETNIYVSIFGSNHNNTIKFAVYFEPDISENNNNPTSDIIKTVADYLTKLYEHKKKEYPSYTYDEFVKSINECSLDESYNHTLLGNNLRYIMRQSQFDKAIKQILGIE